MDTSIPTRFLILSDTHGKSLSLPTEPIDVLIHCGDLTEESQLHEMQTTINMLHQVNAPLKLVIPGNHDFTLDTPMFHTKLTEAKLSTEDPVVVQTYGRAGEARELFEKSPELTFLDEGTHSFILINGAMLTVYASPYTPSTNDWAFQYNPQEDHLWDIPNDVNVVVTHGPPRGIFDQTDTNLRVGGPSLFQAISRSRPMMHCFGHVHHGWGAKLVSWRDEDDLQGEVSHFTVIDNERSRVVQSLATIRAGKYDSEERKLEKERCLEEFTRRGYCTAGGGILGQTMFVNAAIQGCEEDYPEHLPWMVEIGLPRWREEVDGAATTTTGGSDVIAEDGD